jgi:hypothetical protein
MKHRSWIVFSGFVWFFIGMLLLYKGLLFITDAAFQTQSLSYRLRDTFGNQQQAATSLMALGLMIGFFKGRFVLVKTVQRVVARLVSLPTPIRLKDAYTRSYWILIGSMMALGMVFRFLPLPLDVRGTIDVAIGSALINGAILYFRAALLNLPAVR